MNLSLSSAVYRMVVNDVRINETILKLYLRVLFAANIESRKNEKIFKYLFVEKKNIFQIRLIDYFFKTT